MKSLEAAYSSRITASCLAFDLWNGTAINHQRMRAILAVDALRMAIDVLAARVRTMFFLNSSVPTCILVGMVEAEDRLCVWRNRFVRRTAQKPNPKEKPPWQTANSIRTKRLWHSCKPGVLNTARYERSQPSRNGYYFQ